MRANAQKPIQSLHTLWRHYYGGSIAALPLFSMISMRKFFLFSAAIVALGLPSTAQDHEAGQKMSEEKQLDLLFNKIMQTLPDGMRAKVDSAATVKVEHRRVSEEASSKRLSESLPTHERLRKLPDELKAQVERAIIDMEQRKEERKAQFLESHRKK